MADDFVFASDRLESRLSQVDRSQGAAAPNDPDTVKRLLRAGLMPVLPFEWEVLNTKFSDAVAEQNVLSAGLHDAMRDTAETDHDNGSADAINRDSIPLAGRGEGIARRKDNSVLLDYPTLGEVLVTLGSIVETRFGDDEETEFLLVRGRTDRHAKISAVLNGIAELGHATLGSPLGFAMVGLQAGSKATYEVREKDQPFSIVSVRQYNPNGKPD